MREETPGHGGHRGRHGGYRERRGHGEHREKGAQTFRRGRAIAFLERLQVKRSALIRQLNQPEYESIRPVISGELKAVDSIIQEFAHVFELVEAPMGNEEKRDGEGAKDGDWGNDPKPKND
ncbi:hypothetical protein [Cohnella caldifontis]|uniref:hypothetical protein n=1 Tax=Cohnella caldifontis TaxID=3027471 RepID=UPI0023EDA346|nr:hypothetical protein [Cohnella sp. YIM B05605]